MTKNPFPHRRATALLLAAVALPFTPAFAQEVAPPPVTSTVTPPPVSVTQPPMVQPVPTTQVAPPPVVSTAPAAQAEAAPAERSRAAERTQAPQRTAVADRDRAPATSSPAVAPAETASAPTPVAPEAVAPQTAAPDAVAAPVPAEAEAAPVAAPAPVAASTDGLLPWIVGGLVALALLASMLLFSRRRRHSAGMPAPRETGPADLPAYAPQATVPMGGNAAIEPAAKPAFSAAPASTAQVAAAYEQDRSTRKRFAGEPVDPYLAEIQHRQPERRREPVDPFLAQIERNRRATVGAEPSEPVDPYLAEIHRRATPSGEPVDPYLASLKAASRRQRARPGTASPVHREPVTV